VLLSRHIDFHVDVFDGFFSLLEFAVPTDIQSEVASKETSVSIGQIVGSTFFDAINCLIPEWDLNGSAHITNSDITDTVSCSIIAGLNLTLFALTDHLEMSGDILHLWL
jgi:hypothetical protein